MKRRFAACHVQLGDAGKVAKRGDVASVDGEAELVATVRPWGSAAWTFEDTSLETQLWQVQICHSGKNTFGYQLLAMTRSALQAGRHRAASERPQKLGSPGEGEDPERRPCPNGAIGP